MIFLQTLSCVYSPYDKLVFSHPLCLILQLERQKRFSGWSIWVYKCYSCSVWWCYTHICELFLILEKNSMKLFLCCFHTLYVMERHEYVWEWALVHHHNVYKCYSCSLNMAVNHMEPDRTRFLGDGSIKIVLNVPHPSGFGGKVVHYRRVSVHSLKVL